MHKEDTQVLVRALATFTLAGHDLPVIEYRGRPVMFAAKVAEALEGTDYVTGDDLAALKAVDHPTIRGSVDARASSVTLLTEAGAQVAAMLSRTKVGDRVRWDSLYVAEQERRRNEMLIQRRVRVELNQRERRRLVGKLVAEMRDEIEDRRAGKRKVREVADLAGKTWAVIADDRYGQGTEPVLLRDTLN